MVILIGEIDDKNRLSSKIISKRKLNGYPRTG